MESLEIVCSLEVGQAVANAQSLANHLRALRTEAEGLGAAVGTVDTQLGQFASAAQQGTQPATALGKAVQTSSTEFNQYNTQVNLAQQNTTHFNTSASTTVNVTNNIASATRQASTATGSLAGQVTSLVSAYFGMEAVIRIFNQLLEQLNKVRDAQNAIAGNKFEFDTAIQSTMANLNLQGRSGEAVAANLIKDIQSRSGASIERSSDAAEVVNSQGLDVQSESGKAFAAELAMFASRRKFDKESLTQFTRTLAQRGIKDVGGLQKAEAEFDAQFVTAHETDPTLFLRGLVGVMGPETPKGVDPNFAAAMYSAMVLQSRSTLRAQQSTKSVFDIASLSKGTTAEFFAHQAATMGVTSVGAVTDEDLERSGSPKTRAIFEERKKIALEQQKMDLDERRFKDQQHTSRKSPEERSRLEAEHVRAMAAERERIEDRTIKNAEKLEALREKERARRELEAYNAIGTQQRIEKIILPSAIAASGSEQTKNEFSASTGGAIARGDALFELTGNNAQELIARSRAAAAGATAEDTQRANRAYRQTSPSQRERQGAEQQFKNVETADQGLEFNAELDAIGAERAKRELAEGKFSSYGSGLDTYQFNREDFRLIIAKEEELAEAMRRYRSTLQPGTPQYVAVTKLMGQLDKQIAARRGGGPSAFSSSIARDNLAEISRAFGNIAGPGTLSAHGDAGDSAPGTNAIRPATRPTTQPVAGSERSDAGTVHNHYTTNYHRHEGVAFHGGSDDEFDFPGRLENFG